MLRVAALQRKREMGLVVNSNFWILFRIRQTPNRIQFEITKGSFLIYSAGNIDKGSNIGPILFPRGAFLGFNKCFCF